MQWTSVVESQIPDGTAWLTPAELKRAAGMRFTKRRTEYMLRRLAGKRAVATLLWGVDGTTPAHLGRVALLNRRTGAPYAEVDGQSAGIDVSLTDRAGCGICLVGEPGTMEAGSLGIDVEIIEPRSPGFVTDYLTPPEQAYVASRADLVDGHDTAANLLWSAKEAALKVLRLGLRADTRRVVVSIDHSVRPDGWAPLSVDAGHSGTFPGWWRHDGDFLLTLCTRTYAEPPSVLAGSADLASARPVHSWIANPVAPPLDVPGGTTP